MRKETLPDVRLTWLDRAISAFAPGAARRRYDDRVALAGKRRLYDAAAGGRNKDGWTRGPAAGSADAAIMRDGGTLRERSRDLVRNHPLAANAVQVLVNNLVGPGIRPRAKTGNKARDKKVDQLFEAWSKRCDAHGHTDFYGLQALAVREMIEGGDLFAARRPLARSRRRKGAVPLEIELFEAEQLDETRVALSGEEGRRIRDGIEYDASGRRTGYWLMPEHPGDVTPGRLTGEASVRLSVADVAHLYERQRIQSRGVPWGVPAMMALRDHGDWQVAEMVRKKTEACLVGVVMGADTGEDTGLAQVVDAEGNVIEQFRPGMIAYSQGGQSIEFSKPGSAGGIAEWNRVQLHIIAAGFRVPYALMTGDLSQANFSSNRAGLNEFRRMIDQLQWQVIIPMLCQRVWDWFCDAAYTAGLIDRPDVPCEWAPPRFESVNPKQDAETDLLEVRAGFASRTQKIAARGYDARQIEEEISQDNRSADAAGLVLDSDPRKVTKQGMSQATATGEQPGEGEKDEDSSSAPSGEQQED